MRDPVVTLNEFNYVHKLAQTGIVWFCLLSKLDLHVHTYDKLVNLCHRKGPKEVD